jgi:hypothetical protein
MRNLTIIGGLIAAFLCFAQNASAQYLPSQIHRDGNSFVDEKGQTLSDRQLIDAIGSNIYQETVVGARKQYNAGRSLIIGGAIGTGVGLLGTFSGLIMIGAAAETNNSGDVYVQDEDLAYAGAAVMSTSLVAVALGGVALSTGIPLKAIGQSRLNWVENDYNERRGHALHVGATPNGIGLALKF